MFSMLERSAYEVSYEEIFQIVLNILHAVAHSIWILEVY